MQCEGKQLEGALNQLRRNGVRSAHQTSPVPKAERLERRVEGENRGHVVLIHLKPTRRQAAFSPHALKSSTELHTQSNSK